MQNEPKVTLGAENDDGTGFDTQEWPFFWLTQATGLYLAELERSLKKVNLDISRWRVLMCVPPAQAKSVSDIASLAIVKLPTMMKLVQRMESEGLITCQARVGDGRVTEVALTDEGLRARRIAWNSAKKIFARVFPEPDGMEVKTLNKLLIQMIKRLES